MHRVAESLDEIALKFSVDKASVGHDYCRRVYEKLFEPLRDHPITLVELGVFKGQSLATWAQYFHPESTIIGIDLYPQLCELDLPENVRVFGFPNNRPRGPSSSSATS